MRSEGEVRDWERLVWVGGTGFRGIERLRGWEVGVAWVGWSRWLPLGPRLRGDDVVAWERSVWSGCRVPAPFGRLRAGSDAGMAEGSVPRRARRSTKDERPASHGWLLHAGVWFDTGLRRTAAQLTTKGWAG